MHCIWKPIPTMEGRYWVSSDGQVKSKFDRILKSDSARGQKCVSIITDGKVVVYEIRHLIAYAFLGADITSDTKPKLEHIDGDRTNIHLNNLRIADYSDLSDEIWKDVYGLEGIYQVSNKGRVKRLPREDRYIRKDTGKECIRRVGEKILKPIHSVEYDEVDLYHNHTSSYRRIHRLVAEAFISNVDDLSQVNHIDGNKRNNCADNLEWISASENVAHAIRTGLRKNPQKGTYRKPVRLKCIQTDKVYNSIKQAAEDMNMSYAYLSDCIYAKKACHGYTFERIDNTTIKEE